MRLRLLPALVCTLCLLAPSSASADDAPRQEQKSAPHATGAAHLPQSADVRLWLSQQLHRPLESSQILLAPDAATLQGCSIARARRTPTGATAFSLLCPAPALPHLVLLDLSSTDMAAPHPPVAGECAKQHTAEGGPHPPSFGECGVHQALASAPAPSPNIVRAGAALRADWRTEFIHAQLPVVALDSGAAGAAIRVRIPLTNRIVRARILSASTVALIAAGV